MIELPFPFDGAFNKATGNGDWSGIMALIEIKLLHRNDFADTLSWLPRAPSHVQSKVREYIIEYFASHDRTAQDRALLRRFPECNIWRLK